MDKRTRKILKKLGKSAVSSHHDLIKSRAEWVDAINLCAEGGKVLLVDSGMDCDGSAWRDRAILRDAVPVKILREIEVAYEGADGPIHFHVDRPSNRARYEYVQRDLALEAFEDGHPHTLRW